MRIVALSLAVCACAMLTTLVLAQGTPQTPMSLVDVLKNLESSDWQAQANAFKALSGWDKPLSGDEVEAVKSYMARQEHKDWRAHYLAAKLLRANGQLPMPGKAVGKAEEILAPLNPSKGIDSNADEAAGQLAALGADVVPLLGDVLAYPNSPDESRIVAAARALGILDGKDAAGLLIGALKTKIGWMAGELICALMKISSDDAIVDDVAKVIAAQREIDQEFTIRNFEKPEIALRARMRLYSHFDDFKSYGRNSVVRGLGKVANKDAFKRLTGILLKESGTTADIAARQLAGMKSFDPCPAYVDAFDAGKVSRELIICAAIRGCTGAIPYLERVKISAYQDMKADLPLVATGALARLGKDYEKNAEEVRAALGKDEFGSYPAAALLTDDATVRVMGAKLIDYAGKDNLTIKSGSHAYGMGQTIVIYLLGQMPNRLAANTLMDDLGVLPVSIWSNVSDALESLGSELNDDSIASDGAGLKAVIYYCGIGYWQMAPKRDDPEIAKARSTAAAFLKLRPALFKKLFAESMYEYADWGGKSFIVTLAGDAWTPQATPVFEDIIKTDKNVMRYTKTGSGNQLSHYRVREQMAKVLQEKTGRPYTYVDVDGVTRNAGEMP